MQKAYSYIRFSSVEQSKGDSLRRQTEATEKYARDHGLVLDTSLNLRDLGVSAYDKSNITKGALGRFLELVRNGKISPGSVLLVESLDRISRAQVLDAFQIFLDLIKAGITIVTLTDQQEYSLQGLNENSLKLMITIAVMSRASEESELKGRRVKAAWDNKRANIHQRKLTSRGPYWLQLKPDYTAFIEIPDRVATVRRIFQMAKDGHGNHLIVKYLNNEKVPTFSPIAKNWYGSYVQKILTNRAVFGEFQKYRTVNGKQVPDGDPVPDYYPEIVSKEEWLLVNSIRIQRQTPGGGTRKGKLLSNLFSGLLVCGYCKGPMVMGGYVGRLKANGLRTTSRYVACHTARKGAGCRFIQWNYAELETAILTFTKSPDFSEILDKSDLGRSLDKARKQVMATMDDIVNKEAARDRLIAAIESGAVQPQAIANRIGVLDNEISALSVRKSEEQKEISRLEMEILDLQSHNTVLRQLLEKLNTLQGDELHALRLQLSERIRRAIISVELYPGGIYESTSVRLERIEKLRSTLTKAQFEKWQENSQEFSIDMSKRFFKATFRNQQSAMVGLPIRYCSDDDFISFQINSEDVG